MGQKMLFTKVDRLLCSYYRRTAIAHINLGYGYAACHLVANVAPVRVCCCWLQDDGVVACKAYCNLVAMYEFQHGAEFFGQQNSALFVDSRGTELFHANYLLRLKNWNKSHSVTRKEKGM